MVPLLFFQCSSPKTTNYFDILETRAAQTLFCLTKLFFQCHGNFSPRTPLVEQEYKILEDLNSFLNLPEM